MFFKKKTQDTTSAAPAKKYADEWALHKPLFGGSLDAMNKALQKGADINWKNADGMTALYYCCSTASYGEFIKGNYQAAVNLVTLGADPNVLCTANQETALHVLTTRVQKFPYDFSKFQGLANAMIGAGAYSIENKNKLTPNDILTRMGYNPASCWNAKKLEQQFTTAEETPSAEITPVPDASAQPAPASDENPRWVPLNKNEIARVSVQDAIGYKITEIFNFSAKNYKSITQNLETKAETQVTQSFADLNQPDLVNEAELALQLAHTTVPGGAAAVKPKTNLRIVPSSTVG